MTSEQLDGGSAMAMDSLLKLKGKKQGDIEGACGVKGREKDILVLGMTPSGWGQASGCTAR
jgi:hypothetical protein